MEQKDGITLREIARYPWAYVLLVISTFTWPVAEHFLPFQKDDKRTDDCQQQLVLSQEKERKTDSAYKATLYELSIKNEVLKQVPAAVDSAIKHK